MTLVIALWSICGSLLGSAIGAAIRALFLREGAQTRVVDTGTGEITLTGVLSNALIGGLVGLMVGRLRTRTAFLNGLILTLVLGDRLDRDWLGRREGRNLTLHIPRWRAVDDQANGRTPSDPRSSRPA